MGGEIVKTTYGVPFTRLKFSVLVVSYILLIFQRLSYMLEVWWVEERDEPVGNSLVLSEGECKKPGLF